MLARRPRSVVEIGTANGVSSLAILSALRDAGTGGRLISLDPGQYTERYGIGMTVAARAGLADAHELRVQRDYAGLSELLRDETRVDFGDIDCWHAFDYVLLDLWYLDRMVRAGRMIAFDDCGRRSVHKAIKFVQTHRRYTEVDVGLRKDYRARNPMRSLVRRAMGWSDGDRYFEKREDWEPPLGFYAHF